MPINQSNYQSHNGILCWSFIHETFQETQEKIKSFKANILLLIALSLMFWFRGLMFQVPNLPIRAKIPLVNISLRVAFDRYHF